MVVGAAIESQQLGAKIAVTPLNRFKKDSTD
jgi:hypothetical protein